MASRTIEFDPQTGIPSFVDAGARPEGRRITLTDGPHEVQHAFVNDRGVLCSHEVRGVHDSGAVECVNCGKALRTASGFILR